MLTHIIAKLTNLDVGEFVWTGGDVHLYSNHISQAKEQISRTPRRLPELILSEQVTWENLDSGKCTLENFTLNGYNPYPVIKAPIAV